MKKIIIAIDGFSATGKSTVAKQLAKALEYIYVDTGAMYRAITFFSMNNCYNDSVLDTDKLINSLEAIDLKFVYNKETSKADMYLNDKNIETPIRTMEVSNNVSEIASIPQVRAKLVKAQQKMGEDRGIVMDGRDIGTVVFPDAELKIFMNASANTRAERRFAEFEKETNNTVTLAEVLENIEQRDYKDSNREDSPLKQAEDSVLYDNSSKTKQEQFDYLHGLALVEIKK
ncbi:MAG: (d)CMP kinase [Flavobacteriaceae bacterium]|nr:(d)CMP kinase [Flavobacteriaceae bacterium]